MKTNDLKKDDWVLLRNGWYAKITDNRKGNTRMATVHGFVTEMGSIYAHNIMYKVPYLDDFDKSKWIEIEHTPEQVMLSKMGL